MIFDPHDTSVAARDKKAETLGQIGAPYMELLTFLRQTPAEEIYKWAPSAPMFNPLFWNRQDSSHIRCLSYAFNRLWPGLNTHELKLKRHWDVANPPEAVQALIERYARFQRQIEFEFVQPYTGASMVMPEWADSKVTDMREHFTHLLSYGFRLLEKPHDLLPGHNPIAFGLTRQKYVSKTERDFGSAYHYARLDSDGFWSERPGDQPVVSADRTDPLALTSWSAPTCFLQVPAQR